MAAKRTSFGKDTGLQARMLLTLFLLGDDFGWRGAYPRFPDLAPGRLHAAPRGQIRPCSVAPRGLANVVRDPKVKGCGIGDITTMLESGYLGGKCADLNALYVGLARAAGLPARDPE